MSEVARSAVDLAAFTATRDALHTVAERLIAGPQLRESGTIRLEVTAGGFRGVVSGVAVDGTDLVVGDRRFALSGTIIELGAAAGITPLTPHVYHDHAPLDNDEPLNVDGAAAAAIEGWFAAGATALSFFAPGTTPVLWSEHFDLAITVDEVNYGVSLGDSAIARPYAYVGPWAPRIGDFWSQPFGAATTIDDLPAVRTAEAIEEFFRRGRTRAADDPTA